MNYASIPAAMMALVAALSLTPVTGAAQQPWSKLSPEMQIRLAVQAAPKDLQDGVAVQGYDAAGAFVNLRDGSNALICMAPNPTAQSLEVSCHNDAIEPFFARGRELSAQGVTGQERVMTRWREYDEGKLPIPAGSVNYILTGSGFDAATGEIADPYLRWNFYMPGATVESTGISDQPSSTVPWLMFPGTAGAHLMVTPPKGGGGE